MKIFFIYSTIFFVPLACGKNTKSASSSNLVSVAVSDISNLSGDAGLDYLKGSIRDAGIDYMDKIFIYKKLANEEILPATGRFGTVKPDVSQQVTLCSQLRSDILIHSSFTAIGKKQKQIDVETTVFRCDEGVIVETIKSSAKINNSIFDEIQKMAVSIVNAIASYQKKMSGTEDQKTPAADSGEKIILSKESLKILPFIPPVF